MIPSSQTNLARKAADISEFMGPNTSHPVQLRNSEQLIPLGAEVQSAILEAAAWMRTYGTNASADPSRSSMVYSRALNELMRTYGTRVSSGWHSLCQENMFAPRTFKGIASVMSVNASGQGEGPALEKVLRDIGADWQRTLHRIETVHAIPVTIEGTHPYNRLVQQEGLDTQNHNFQWPPLIAARAHHAWLRASTLNGSPLTLSSEERVMAGLLYANQCLALTGFPPLRFGSDIVEKLPKKLACSTIEETASFFAGNTRARYLTS